MLLTVVLIVFLLIEVICFCIGLKSKYRNKSLIAMLIIAMACDVIGLFFERCRGVRLAKQYFVIYYVLYAWISFVILTLVISFAKQSKQTLLCAISGVVCLYQTLIVVSNFWGSNSILCTRHIFLGNNWWIASANKNANPFFSFYLFEVLCIVNAILFITAIIMSSSRTATIYSTRTVAISLSYFLYIMMEILARVFSVPIWVNILFLFPGAVITFMVCTIYLKRQLRAHSLALFSNEMSDGFAVYDEMQELLYVNNVIRSAFDAETQAKFNQRSYMEEWCSHTEEIEGTRVRPWTINGNEVYFAIRKQELMDNNLVIGYIYIFQNVTSAMATIKKMEEANFELEQAAKMKSDFLANMSHEIRTPMNAVIGMTELALRDTREPAVVEYLYQIKKSGRNLLNIINDILDFSKIEAGKMEIINDNYDLLTEINDITNTLMTRIGDKNIELIVTESPDIPRTLYGDAMRIRQILINLANNAIKFTQEGMVHITVDCDQIDDKHVMMNYHVVDTGNGIKEEDLKVLFNSFQQVDSKRNRAVEGTGLGLAISKKLCQAMGGSIGVSSEYGKGSDFYFSVPQEIVDDTLTLLVDNKEKKRAVYLDDESLITQSFTSNMEQLGIEYLLLSSIDEYRNEGTKDYIFFNKQVYGPSVEKILRDNPECLGIEIVGYGEMVEENIPNLRIMKKPVTTFVFSLILNDRKGVYKRVENVDTLDFTAPEARILIVDDNAINLTVAVGLLEPLHMQIQTASSGKEAIELLYSEDFDIVFMDHMMPEMDGVETTERIRHDFTHLANMPIIALTANAMAGNKELFIERGMNDFVSKPVELNNIVSKIRQWLPTEKIIYEDVKSNEYASNDDEIVYQGLDSERAIKMLGSPKLYQIVVKEYYKVGSKKITQIRESYNNNDWSRYTIEVHALKSASRQIGAMGLGDLAERMEQAGKESDIEAIRRDTDKMLELYQTILDSLQPTFGENSSQSELPLIGAEELKQFIDDLIAAEEDLDISILSETAEKMKTYRYPEEINDRINMIYDAIDEFDFEKCSELCSEIMNISLLH